MPLYWHNNCNPTGGTAGIRLERVAEPDLLHLEYDEDEGLRYQLAMILVRVDPAETNVEDYVNGLDSIANDDSSDAEITVLGISPARDTWREVARDWADEINWQVRRVNAADAMRGAVDAYTEGDTPAPDRTITFPGPTTASLPMFDLSNRTAMNGHFSVRQQLIGADQIQRSEPYTGVYASMDAVPYFPQVSYQEGLGAMIEAFISNCNGGNVRWGEWRRILTRTGDPRSVLSIVPPIIAYPELGPLTAITVDAPGNVWLRFQNTQRGRVQGMWWPVGSQAWDWWDENTPGCPDTSVTDGRLLGGLILDGNQHIRPYSAEMRYQRWDGAMRRAAERWPQHFPQRPRVARTFNLDEEPAPVVWDQMVGCDTAFAYADTPLRDEEEQPHRTSIFWTRGEEIRP